MGFDASKTKLQLKGAIQRIQILSKKKTAVSAASKAEISQLLLQKKDDKARIKVEHIIRDDLLVEALELLEIYCETLLARFSTLEQMRHCDPGISEAVNTIIYASPRVGVDELINVRNQLIMKYGKEFADASMENRNNCVNDRIIVKLQTKTPEQLLVNQYLKTIADSYKVNWDYERPIEELPPAPPPLNYGAELGAQYQPSAPPANQFYPSAPQSFNAGPPDHTNGGVKVLPTGTPSDVNLGSPVSAPSAPPPADSMSDFDAMQKRFQDLKSKK